MFNKKIILTTLFTIITADKDYDGSYNYLFKADKYNIAYSSTKELPYKEGEAFKAKVKANCEQAWGVDEVASERYNTWVTFQDWLCVAEEVILDE